MQQPATGGRLEVFAPGPDGNLGHIWQLATGGWSAWSDLGPAIRASSLAVYQNADGRLEVFAKSPDGKLGHTYQLKAGGGTGWEPWSDFGPAILSDPAVVQEGGDVIPGHLVVFARGAVDSKLGHMFQMPAQAGGGWSEWLDVGLPAFEFDSVAIFQNFDGRLEIFAKGTDGNLGHTYELTPGGGTDWAQWSDLGPAITTLPAVFSNFDGRLEVFAVGPDGNLGHTYQLDPGGGKGWGAWSDLGPAITSDPVVFRNSDGRLEVFARGPAIPPFSPGNLSHIWQLKAGGGTGWSAWNELAPTYDGDTLAYSVAVASNLAGM